MDEHVGLRRSEEGLRRAVEALRAVKTTVEARPAPLARSLAELRSAATVGLRVARAALDNERSVGCHYRVDAPAAEAAAGRA
jgi:L-aspartate oxidase